jgi:hypothetical protein
MKRLMTLLVAGSLAFAATAQQDDLASRQLLDRVSGNLLYVFQYVDVKGSPFLMDQWVTGRLDLDQRTYFDRVKLKFDVYNNSFILNRHDTAYQVSKAIREVRLYPSDDTAAAMLFRNGYTLSARIGPAMYVQVLADGRISLLKYDKKEMQEYTEYGDATKYKRFEDASGYFILGSGAAKSITLSKKNLQETLGDRWPAVADYMTTNYLNGKDERSWAMAIKFYDSLP